LKRLFIRILLLALFSFALPYLLSSCDTPEENREANSLENAPTTIQATVPIDLDDVSNRISEHANEEGVIFGRAAIFDVAQNVFESINPVLREDFQGENINNPDRGIYWFEREERFLRENMTDRIIPLSDSQVDALEAIINHAGFVFDTIRVTEERIAYSFGLGRFMYIYTFDGQPPSYYARRDRNENFHSESLGGNWFLALP